MLGVANPAGILTGMPSPDTGAFAAEIAVDLGGGTSLATQRECLDLLGCSGKGKVNKLAEIIAGVALAGEISLASAISSSDWVSSHEQYGRNR